MTETQKQPEERRVANLGVDIDTKKLGKLTVREFTLESILDLAGELSTVLGVLEASRASDGLMYMAALLRNDQTKRLLFRVAAASCGHPVDDFSGMSLNDWLKWLKAFRDVNDWEELKELFTELVPAAMLEKLRGAVAKRPLSTSPESSTTLEPNTAGSSKTP